MGQENVYNISDTETKSDFSVVLENDSYSCYLVLPFTWRTSDSGHILSHKIISGMITISYIHLS